MVNKKRAKGACWYVRNDQGEQFGPVDLETLNVWAGDGRLSPTNEISDNASEWRLATSLRELGMDWVAEVTPGAFYGPIHHKAMQELVKEGALKDVGAFFARSDVKAENLRIVSNADENDGEKAKRDDAQKKVESLEAEVKALRTKQTAEQSELLCARKELSTLSDQVISMRAKEASLTGALTEQSKRFDAELEHLKQAVQRAETVSIERASRIAELEGQLAGKARDDELRSQAVKRVEALENELKQAHQKMEQGAKAVAISQTREQELGASLATVQQALAKESSEAKELRTVVQSMRGEQDEMQKALTAAQQRNQKVETILRQAVDLFATKENVEGCQQGTAKSVEPIEVIEAEVLSPEPVVRNSQPSSESAGHAENIRSKPRPPVVNHTRQTHPGLSLADLEQQARREIERLGAQGKSFFKKK